MLIVVLTIVGIVVAGVGVAYTRKQASPPKRVLRVDAPPPAPLLATDSAAEIGIEVKRDGLALAHPRLILSPSMLTATTTSLDRVDDNQPIAVDLGAPIVELLQHKGITAAADGTTLLLGPDLIKRGSRASLLVLVDGPASVDSVASQIEASMIDVTVATSSQSAINRRRGLAGTISVVVAVAVTLVLVGLTAWAFYVEYAWSICARHSRQRTGGLRGSFRWGSLR